MIPSLLAPHPAFFLVFSRFFINLRQVLDLELLLSLEITSADEDTLKGSETEVIMTLVTELLVTEFEEGDDLSTKAFSCLEALRVEHDSGNHLLVWLCHGNLPEQLFEIVRQFGSASVAWIHGDKDSHLRVESDLSFHHVDLRLLLTESSLDAKDLLGYS